MKHSGGSSYWLLALIPVALLGCKAGNAPDSSTEAYFPPEAVDHLAMTVNVSFEIFAIGKDTMDLDGTVAVHRSGPMPPDGKSMEGDLIGASLRGNSDVFGEVVAMHSPIQHSPCMYEYMGPSSYEGHFDIHGWFWLPQHDLVVFSGEPVRVEGTAKAIPPVGQRARMTVKDIPLFDLRRPSANPIGVLTQAAGDIHRVVTIEDHMKRPDTTVQALSKSK